jgi:hypothetical protein
VSGFPCLVHRPIRLPNEHRERAPDRPMTISSLVWLPMCQGGDAQTMPIKGQSEQAVRLELGDPVFIGNCFTLGFMQEFIQT